MDNLRRTLSLFNAYKTLSESNKQTFIEGYAIPELVRQGLFFEAGQVVYELLNEELKALENTK